ncbi:hypothetical protein HYW46_05000 [Candidatus Daviesbacteria bacterium]|nr:hypothetical protein [Candidatus Daviesbacteria bacterium]
MDRERNVNFEVEMPKESYQTLENIAYFTDVQNIDWLAKVMQDALRVYDRILQYQSQRKTVALLDDAQLSKLAD